MIRDRALHWYQELERLAAKKRLHISTMALTDNSGQLRYTFYQIDAPAGQPSRVGEVQGYPAAFRFITEYGVAA